MKGCLLMSEKERVRNVILAFVASGHLNLKEAALRLSISYGQMKRLWKRYQALGDAGLLHQARGKVSNHGKPLSVKQAIIACYWHNYVDFGPTLAAEKLQAADYIINHETLRRWLIQAGLWQLKSQRPKHRQRRLRKSCFGELVQLDGWFASCLVLRRYRFLLFDEPGRLCHGNNVKPHGRARNDPSGVSRFY